MLVDKLGSRTIIENTVLHCNKGIAVDDYTCVWFPSLPPDAPIIQFQLSKVPFYSSTGLKDGQRALFSLFGSIIERGIHRSQVYKQLYWIMV